MRASDENLRSIASTQLSNFSDAVGIRENLARRSEQKSKRISRIKWEIPLSHRVQLAARMVIGFFLLALLVDTVIDKYKPAQGHAIAALFVAWVIDDFLLPKFSERLDVAYRRWRLSHNIIDIVKPYKESVRRSELRNESTAGRPGGAPR